MTSATSFLISTGEQRFSAGGIARVLGNDPCKTPFDAWNDRKMILHCSVHQIFLGSTLFSDDNIVMRFYAALPLRLLLLF